MSDCYSLTAESNMVAISDSILRSQYKCQKLSFHFVTAKQWVHKNQSQTKSIWSYSQIYSGTRLIFHIFSLSLKLTIAVYIPYTMKNRIVYVQNTSYNTSYKFWDEPPSPHYQCCLKVSETVSWSKLRCCYSSDML